MIVSSGLVPLLVVNLLYSLLSRVSSINCFSIVIRNVSSLTGACNGVVMFVYKLYELGSLKVCDLDVLSYHW